MTRIETILCTILAFLLAVSSYAQNLQDDLKKLDNALDMAENYKASHELRVGAIENSLANSNPSLREQYNLYNEMYKAQLPYKFDLAKEALDRRAAIAEELNDKVMISETNVDKAYLFCVAGLYLESEQAAAEIDTTLLNHVKLIDYYNYKQRFYYDFHDNATVEDIPTNRTKVSYYRNRVMEETDSQSSLHRYMKVRELLDEGKLAEADSVSTFYTSNMDRSSHEYAEISYYKAVICEGLGNLDDMFHWYINSAIADIQSNTKDNASLQCIAVELLKQGKEIERAFRYTQYSLNDAIFYNSKLRPWQIAMSLPAIENAYYQEQEKHEQGRRILMAITIALALLILMFALKMVSLYAKQKKTHAEMEEMNRKIQETVQDLSMANAAKEEYIGLFLSMCSKYIDKLKKYMTMSEIDAELKNFYKTFDNAFLQLYPDFVEKFNSLLKPESKIELKKDELLNTELRIFALIKLGITQSSHIATLLRYSVNTIYNYRAQIKNAAIDGKDSFEDMIKKI